MPSRAREALEREAEEEEWAWRMAARRLMRGGMARWFQHPLSALFEVFREIMGSSVEDLRWKNLGSSDRDNGLATAFLV